MFATTAAASGIVAAIRKEYPHSRAKLLCFRRDGEFECIADVTDTEWEAVQEFASQMAEAHSVSVEFHDRFIDVWKPEAVEPFPGHSHFGG